jgi:capsular polysaccharide biosynthesis protein
MLNRLQRRIVLLTFISIVNLIFGIYVITSVFSANEFQTTTNVPVSQSNTYLYISLFLFNNKKIIK